MSSQGDSSGRGQRLNGAGGAWAAPRESTPSSLEESGVWQWEHKKGWRVYELDSCKAIEEAYHGGQAMVRLKAGKDGQTIMELFFEDMIQHDTKTRNRRGIRRVGRETCRQRWCRRAARWLNSIESGRPYRMSFEQYQQQRQEYLESLETSDFDPAELYYKPSESLCARIARHPLFFVVSMTSVLLNALWLGYDANENNTPTIYNAPKHFLIVEQTFCVFFTVELLIRFGAFRHKCEFRKDYWFVFDLVLVLMMVGETWVLQPICMAVGVTAEDSWGDFSVLRLMRLLKLTRLTRFVRLLHFFPDMLTMLRGIGRAMMSVFFTTLLLVVLLYVFGIIFKLQAEAYDTLQDSFSTVGETMWWLLLHGTFLDAIADVVPLLRNASPVMTMELMVFTFFSHLTLLNMLVGILCEVVSQVSKTEKEQAAVSAFKAHLLPILEIYAVSNAGRLRKEEFELLMRNPEMHMILNNLGVDAGDFNALKDILYEDKATTRAPADASDSDEDGDDAAKNSVPEEPDLTFAEFMESALRLRGGNQARVQDVVELREYVKNRVDELAPMLLSQLQRAFRGEDPPAAPRASSRRSSRAGLVRNPPSGSEALCGDTSAPLRAAGADIPRPEQPSTWSAAEASPVDGEGALSRELASLRAEVKALREQAFAPAPAAGGSAAQESQPGSAEILQDLAQIRGEIQDISNRLEHCLQRCPRTPQPPRRHWDEMGNLAETV